MWEGSGGSISFLVFEIRIRMWLMVGVLRCGVVGIRVGGLGVYWEGFGLARRVGVVMGRV